MIGLVSDGATTSGLGTTALGSQTVAVTGKVYRYASAGVTTPVSLGNVHVGGTFGTSNVSLSNTAIADGYSEGLDASIGSTTGATGSGSVSNLAAGSSSTGISVSLTNTATAGHQTGTVGLNLTSDGNGTSGLGTTSIASQTVTVSGNVYRLASATASAAPVSLGNVHVGGTFGSSTVSLSNTATADGYSEGLDATIGSTSGATASGSVSNLAAGSTSTAISINLTGTGTAGTKTGTLGLNLVSDGATTSGLGTTALGSQTVTVTGNVYRLASASTITTPINLGNIHTTGSFSGTTLALSNTATADGFSEGLDASVINTTGAASGTGSISNLAAGSSNNSLISVGLANGGAGLQTGSVVIGLVSDGATTSGLGTTALGSQTVAVTGKVYRYASAGVTTPVSLGNVHVGGTFGTSNVSLSNTAIADGYSEGLDASIGSTTGATGSGSVSNLAAGSSSTGISVSLTNTATAGHQTGTVGLNLTSDGNGTSGLGTTSIASQTVTVSGNVYRLASATASAAPVSLGNVHVGGTFGSSTVSLSNTATADGYSEGLDATIGSTSGATASGSVSNLAAGSTSTAISINLTGTGTAGTKTGTLGLNLVSDGATTSGLGTTALGSQTVTVTGNVYRLASASTITTPINLGNIHTTGSFSGTTLALSNTATADGFSEGLDASVINTTGAASGTGSISNLAAGSSNNSLISVGLANGGAGLQTGSVVIGLVSDGATTSGLGTTALGSQTVAVTGKVYRYASAGVTTPVSLGNVHVGGTFGTSNVSLSNTAIADGYSEKLDATGSAAGSATTTGSVTLLGAGATSTGISVGLTGTGSAGNKSGSVTLGLTSDGAGTSNLGTTSIASQTVAVTGNVYRLASATASAAPVSLGNVHVGGTFGSSTVSLSNTATADGYSEGLDATIGSTSGATATGSVSNLAAGSTSTAISINLTGTGSAGTKTGTLGLNLVSDGATTSGLGTTALGSQTVTVTGNVYRLASASTITTPVNLGNIHTDGSFSGTTLALSNTATADGFSEGLDASVVNTTGAASSAGSITNLAAGSSNNSSITVGLGNGGAGAQSGTVVVGLVSDGATTSGLGTTAIGSQTVTVAGTVFRYAAAGTTPTTIDYGTVHQGASFSGATSSISLSNTAIADGYSEGLDASVSSTSGGASGSGSVSLLAAGSTNGSAFTVGFGGSDNSTAGTKTGTVVIGLTSDGAGTSNLGTTSIGSQTVTLTGNVYSGQSHWTSPTDGAWGLLGVTSGTNTFGQNWAATDGSPGLDTGYKGVDTANFDSDGSGTSTLVHLNGAAPDLHAITFDSTATSYTIDQGTGTSSITLSSGTGTITPLITVTSGDHTIAAPILLNAATTITDNGSLALTKNITGSQTLTHAGSGITTLTGSNAFSHVAVNSGSLYANAANAIGTSAVMVNGGTFGGSATVTGGVTLATGGTLKSGIIETGTLVTAKMTLDNSTLKGTILDASAGGVVLAFNLGAGTNGLNHDTTTNTPFDFTNPNIDSSYLNVVDDSHLDAVGELKFNLGTHDIISLTDITSGGLQLTLDTPYLLIKANSNADYAGLVTSGGTMSLVIDGMTVNDIPKNGWVENLDLQSNGNYVAQRLYLYNGDLEVVPEPGTWALMIGGLAVLILIQRRRGNRSN